MLSPAEGPEHFQRLLWPGGLSEGPAVQHYDRVRPDDDRGRAHICHRPGLAFCERGRRRLRVTAFQGG